MKADFTNIKKDEYELSLPLPVFSELAIRREISGGTITQDVIRLESHQHFFVHVFSDSEFIRVEQEIWQGRRIAVTYRLDMRHMKPGEIWKGNLHFLYLGGEKTIPVHVTSAPEYHKEQPGDVPVLENLPMEEVTSAPLFQ